MHRTFLCCIPLLLAAGVVHGDGPKGDLKNGEGDKLISGMSIVGNDEAPKSLVIVPWKSSELGNTLDVSRALDAGRRPVDRDVFARSLHYYEIRVGAGGGRGSAADSQD